MESRERISVPPVVSTQWNGGVWSPSPDVMPLTGERKAGESDEQGAHFRMRTARLGSVIPYRSGDAARPAGAPIDGSAFKLLGLLWFAGITVVAFGTDQIPVLHASLTRGT